MRVCTVGYGGRPPSKGNLEGDVGFFQFLRNFRHRNAFGQAKLIWQTALNPSVASSTGKKGEEA
jgi:hypothetical protein